MTKSESQVGDNRQIDYQTKRNAPVLERVLQCAADEQDAGKYRRLKQLAAETKDHESELEFFCLELKAKRFYETGSVLPILLNWLYELVSNFGRDVWRPFACWLGLTILSMVLIGAVLLPRPLLSCTCPGEPGRAEAYSSVVRMAFTNSLALISGDKLTIRQRALTCLYGEKTGPTLLGELGITLQSLASLILFFLIGLALRNRFRIGGGG